MPEVARVSGAVSRATFALLAPALFFAQHVIVAAIYAAAKQPLAFDAEFWLLPLRRFAFLPGLNPTLAASGFVICLIISGCIAALSFGRATRLGWGYSLAALSIVPAAQIVSIIGLAILPPRATPAAIQRRTRTSAMLRGAIAGVALIVLAVLVSVLTFGAYGWGLFVGTPFLVGVTTAYIANRGADLKSNETMKLVVAATALGGLALLMTALEGFLCIVLIAPLALPVALAGGAIGQLIARAGNRRRTPILCLSILPAVFMLEAAMPPTTYFSTIETVEISAASDAVWAALVSDKPYPAAPGLVAYAGLAYPMRGRLLGSGVGAIRLGVFSTGVARERVTQWQPGRELAFDVVAQPPAMEEMSPYRKVHAPHVRGYFDTAKTTFTLTPTRSGGTRLSMTATHVLRLDPVHYWKPLAKWAARENTRGILAHIKATAEQPKRGAGIGGGGKRHGGAAAPLAI